MDVKQMMTVKLASFVMVTMVASKTWDATATALPALAIMKHVTCLAMKTASGVIARIVL